MLANVQPLDFLIRHARNFRWRTDRHALRDLA